MKTDMQEQWRREYDDYSRKKNPLPNMGGDPCWDSYLKAKQSSQETIENLKKENQELHEIIENGISLITNDKGFLLDIKTYKYDQFKEWIASYRVKIQSKIV